MARQRRKRIKFSPFRMGKRFERGVIVAIGVFLMFIFAMPFAGPCRRSGGPGPDNADAWATLDGKKLTYGEIRDLSRRWNAVFGKEFRDFDQGGAQLAQYHEAKRAGIHVSDAQVHDEIRNTIFPRRVQVEYAIAEPGEFEKGLEELAKEQRAKRADELARQAIGKVKSEVDEITSEDLEGALKRSASKHKLTFGQTETFTRRGARRELDAIRDAPDVVARAFTERIGQLSEPLTITGGYCIFRVILRTRGFGPDGRYYPAQEGWAGEGYGKLSVKSYRETLNDMRVTQSDLELTLRERLTVATLADLVTRTASSLPDATLRDRYYRDHTQAVAAYFALRTSSFTDAATCTDDELRAFYDEHKSLRRTATTPGYLEPPRVSIEYVLGRKDDVGRTLDEPTLRRFYQRFPDRYDGAFEDMVEKVRKDAADHELQRIISTIAGQAADEANSERDPGFEALARQASRMSGGAFDHGITNPFSADEADNAVPQLRGAKLAEQLFGDEGRQYAAAREERKPGMHIISADFTCDAGRYFFRLLERIPVREIPFEEFVKDKERRQLLEKDAGEHSAFERARALATAYRTAIGQAAVERLAALVGAKPVATGFLMAEQPVPPLEGPVAALYAQLERSAIGDLSDVFAVGDRYVAARLVDRAEGKGLKLQVVAFRAADLKGGYEPSDFELQAAYDTDPHGFLDPPKPVPFDNVKADIARLLGRRRALETATERADGLARELADADKPDLKAAATKHKLAFHASVKVGLAKTEAAPHVGKAAGFHDAVTSLKPRKASKPLASAAGRCVFVLKARDDKSATIDVAVAAYDAIAAETKVADKDVRKYYDDHRDTAYVTNDEIKTAPTWPALDEKARGRVRKQVVDAWAKKPEPERLAAVRNAAVEEAFRTVPVQSPVTSPKPLRLASRAVGPFSLSSPPGRFAGKPELVAALRALKVGEVTKPMATDGEAVLAFLAARKPGGDAKVSIAVFNAPDFLNTAKEPSDDELKRYYDAHKEEFRVPETAAVELLFADTASRQKAVLPKLTDDEVRRHYQDHRPQYGEQTYDQAKAMARGDLARERAQQQASKDAQAALEALLKDAKADLKALAVKHHLTLATPKPFALRDPVVLEPAGKIPELADDLGGAEAGALVNRVVVSEKGCLVCRLVERKPEHVPPLSDKDIRARAVRALKLTSAREAAHKAAEQFRAQAARTSFEKAMTALGPKAPNVLRGLSATAPSLSIPRKGPMPKLAEAVFALQKPGLTAVVDEADTSCVAWVAERTPDQLVELDLVTIRRPQVSVPGLEASDEEIRAHYDKHKESFRVPDQLQIQYLGADYETLAETLTATDKELREEYDRSTKARETLYKDWSKPGGLFFQPFEKARDQVRRRVLNDKAKAKARQLLAAAATALRKQGAKADLGAYAAKVAGLEAGASSFFGAESKALEPIGRAPEVVKKAFAAKQGEIVGPEFGPDGACIFRRKELKASHIPPLDEQRYTVEADLLRRRDLERAMGVAAKLRERVAEALAKADDAREAFRDAVAGKPIIADVPVPARVTVTKPFYPLDAGWYRSDAIPGLGRKPDLNRAVFRLRKGELTAVIEDADRSACYVAALTRLVEPDEPGESDLLETRARIVRRTALQFWESWRSRLNERLTASR